MIIPGLWIEEVFLSMWSSRGDCSEANSCPLLLSPDKTPSINKSHLSPIQVPVITISLFLKSCGTHLPIRPLLLLLHLLLPVDYHSQGILLIPSLTVEKITKRMKRKDWTNNGKKSSRFRIPGPPFTLPNREPDVNSTNTHINRVNLHT